MGIAVTYTVSAISVENPDVRANLATFYYDLSRAQRYADDLNPNVWLNPQIETSSSFVAEPTEQQSQSSVGGMMQLDRIVIDPSTSPVVIFRTLSNGDELLRGLVVVEVPFDGAPTLRIGTDELDLLGIDDVDLTKMAQYESPGVITVGQDDFLRLFFEPGGCTVGKAKVLVSLSEAET